MGRVSKYPEEFVNVRCGWSPRCARSTVAVGGDRRGGGHVGDRHAGDGADLDPPLGSGHRPWPGVRSPDRRGERGTAQGDS